MTTIHASPPSTEPDMPLQRVARQALRDHWKLFAVRGAMLMAFGLAAILLPTVAALTFDILVGWPATAGRLLGPYVGINLTFIGLDLLLAAIGVHATQP
ncbi:MAG: hypothetical protein R3F54_21545 [Alphaproteobacteria bacterium]